MSLRVNTLANFGGRIVSVGLGAILVPVYVKLLGIEAYALVGISASIQAIFGLLDLGMAAAFCRELSRLEAFEERRQEERDLLATFDVIYIGLALIVMLLIELVAPFIAHKWVTAKALDAGSILFALRLIGVNVALQLPTSFYLGGLIGIERQVVYNVVNVTSAVVRGVGTITVLLFVGSTVQNFFVWQALVSLGTVVAAGTVLHRFVDRGAGRGVVRFALVKQIWRYAAGWLANTVGTNLTGQVDKIVLSRVLPLAQFGYYTLAGTVALLLWNLVLPVQSAAFPRFNASIAAGNEEQLRHDYFSANQLLALVLIPVGAVVMAFPRHALMLWTRDAVMAASTERVMVIFAAGMTIAGLSNLALHLTLAHGWFRPPIAITLCAAAVAVPVMIFGGKLYGAPGGALGSALQTAAVIVLVPILHSRYLKGEGGRWLLQTILLPGAAAGVVCALAYLIRPGANQLILTAVFLFGTWLSVSMAVALVEPELRASLVRLLQGRRPAFLTRGDLP